MITEAKKRYRNYLSKCYARFYLQLHFVQYILSVMFRLIELTASFHNSGKGLCTDFGFLHKLNYMEPHFTILIPCTGFTIYKWEVSAFYLQPFLMYLSKLIHLQSALSVLYRQADINQAFRFICLAGSQATRGSIDFFLVLWFFFFFFFYFIFFRITMRDMPGELAWFVHLIWQAIFFFPGEVKLLKLTIGTAVICL